MTGPHPAVAAVRSAVREGLEGLDPGTRLWVALSGGADSLALAAATAFVGAREGHMVGAIIVDHGLQEGSARVARDAAAQARLAGIASVHIERVDVGRDGGLEAAARSARYGAIDARVRREGGRDPHVLTGHTMDDQAETVLLALARGSGARALSGIPPRRGNIIRPLLGVRRSDTEQACAALSLTPWHDPTNEPAGGPRRSALRGEVIPALVGVLGPGVVPALARSAALLQADADELDRQARATMVKARRATSVDPAADSDDVPCELLATLPDAIRGRMLKMLAERSGAGPMTATHVHAMDQLVVNYRGQGAVSLPGGFEVRREYGRLIVSVPDHPRSADA